MGESTGVTKARLKLSTLGVPILRVFKRNAL